MFFFQFFLMLEVIFFSFQSKLNDVFDNFEISGGMLFHTWTP